MATRIPMYNGGHALVDEEDYEYLSRYRWTAKKEHHTTYAYGYIRELKKVRLMHRIIMNPPAKMEIDHLDRNGLNNTKANLRICTHVENMARCVQKPRSSKYYGVTRINGTSKYTVTFKGQHLGVFDDERVAAMVWNEASKALNGTNAVVNIL